MKRKLMGAVLVMVLATMPISTVQATEMKEPTVEAEDIIGVSATDVVIAANTKLTEDKVVTGDLYVRAPLDLNGFNIQVKGDVYAEADVFVDSGEKLTVAGNYMQKARHLEVNGGTVTIGGDLRVFDTDETGKRVMGTGCVRLFTTNSTVTIDGDMILNTDCINGMMYGASTMGVFTLKGDLIQEHSGAGFKPQNLILAGTGEQTLSLMNDANIGKLQVTNGAKIQVTNYFNAGLGSDVTLVAKNGTVKTSFISLNGNKLQINGNVQAEGDVYVQDGAKLTVTGDYMQKTEELEMKAGTVGITGDLLLYSLDDAGKEIRGDGHIVLASTDSAISIDGDMIMNTECYNGMYYGGYTAGTITLKGDLIQEHSGSGFRPQNLILAGTEEQTLTLLPDSFLGNLQVKNNINILVTDWFNASLGSDISLVTTTEEWSIRTNQLIFNGKELNVNGNFLAEGDVKVGSGTLKVKGSYWQMIGGLLITDGHVNVSNDLLIQNVDENGKPVTGEGYLQVKDQNGFLKVGGSMLLNTTSNMFHYVNGKILIRKDLIQEPAEAFFRPAYIYMEGAGAQKISFASANAKIGTLELGQHISKYTFNPNPCWNKLIEVENPFSDVKVNGWEFPYVKFALDYSLMGGKGTGNDGKVIFDPSKNMTRAEFVQALYNKEGKPAVSYTNVFSDVPADKWFTNAIMWAYQNNIVKGKEGKFDVSGNITREEMATILYKYAANYKKYEVEVGATLEGYTDVSSISSWATKNIEWAIWCGVMKGKGTQIAPRDYATRAECATMLRNFIMAYED